MKTHYHSAMVLEAIKVHDEEDIPPETRAKLAGVVTKLQPAGMENLLKEKLQEARISWDDYKNNSMDALERLIKLGLVVKPDLKLSREYQQFRKSGGFYPPDESSDLQQNFSDALKRFIETRLNAGPEQVMLVTSGNNFFPVENAMTYIKRSQVLQTPRCKSIEDAVRFPIAAHAIAAAFKNAPVGGPYVAADFQGVRYTERAFRVVQLATVFRGQLMHQMLPPNIDDVKLGKAYLYAPENYVLETGLASIVSNIPSLSRPGRVHYASLLGMPVVDRNHGSLAEVVATRDAVVTSYDFHTYQTTSEKEALIPVKFIRGLSSDETEVRKGSEKHISHTSVFAALRSQRTAASQLKEGDAPGRAFLVLPMFPEIPPDAMRAFYKFYGLKSSTGAFGGVILENITREVGLSDRENITRTVLPFRILDLDIALVNLVAYAKYDLTPKGPKIDYSQLRKN